jgi:ketosteroid isomerase-like protein
MRNPILKVTAALLAVAAAGFAAAADRATTKQALIEADRAFGAATAARGVEGWLSFFADNATIFPLRGPVIAGLPAIREHYAATGFSPRGLTWTPIAAELAACGELGYTWGYWEQRVADAVGSTVVAHGKYLTVWRLIDGKWMVAADVGNIEPPAASSETKPAAQQ